MVTNTNVTNMKFNKLSSNKYGTITPNEGEFYCTPDDNVVHTTGNETIAGNKTFSNNITANADIVIDKNVAIGSNSQTLGLSSYTNNNKLASLFQGWAEPTRNATGMYAFNSSGAYGEVAVFIDENGNTTTAAPTPATSDNSNQIATTAFVNNYTNTMVSNCITEIPQDIKITLSADKKSAYVEAGTKMYYPDGFEQDGTTKKFTVITVTTQKQINFISNSVCPVVFRYNQDSGNGVFWANVPIERCVSGSSVLTDNTYEWYDTTNNIEGYAVNGVIGDYDRATLPLGILTVDSNGVITNVQTFNGFGYIGSTLFSLPGVKGLIPNGRNADGTLKSIEFVNSSVRTYTYTYTINNWPVIFGPDKFYSLSQFKVEDTPSRVPTSGQWFSYYSPKDNKIYQSDNGGDWFVSLGYIMGNEIISSGKVTSLTPKTAFHAVDYNDYHSLSNKVDTNTSNIALKQDIATAVNYNNITNCITEIPQDIKLELNNGTLTLKAGSKVYVPNGFESDGATPKFNEVVISNNMNMNGGAANGQEFVYLVANGSALYHYLDNSSGTDWTATSQYQCRYNTTDNMIKNTNDTGSTWLSQVSFPIAKVTLSSGTVTSIDQVFNGFGYIGSTVFALPGVKGLIPNGRNADGTLKNFAFTVSNVISETRQDYGTKVRVLKLGANYISGMAKTNYRYDEINNFNYESNNLRNYAILGELVTTNNKIDSFTMPTAFHALDYNDSSTIVGWGMPDYTRPTVITSSVNSTNGYTAEVDCFIKCFCSALANSTVNPEIKIGGYPYTILQRSANNQFYNSCFWIMPLAKGQNIQCNSFTGVTWSFQMFPMKG